jgi:AcrR family transcriptional regulator
MPEIIDAATKVFARTGYRLTQMADVAREMGVAPGTLYLYVESKEALFDLVVRHGLETKTDKPLPEEVPVPTPEPGATLDYLNQVLDREGRWPLLTEALGRARAPDIARELEEILVELHDLMLRNRWGLRVLSRSALDWPQLAMLFLGELRRRLLVDLTRYIELRVAAGQLREVPDAWRAAAFLNESLATWVLHRFGDPGYASLRDEPVKQTVIDALVHAYIER